MTLQTLQTQGPEALHRQQIAVTVNEVIKGRANNTGEFTLTAGATTTTVIDPAFESAMVPVWTPTTLNAAAALSTTYLTSRDKGSFVVTHANAGTTDRTFIYLRWG